MLCAVFSTDISCKFFTKTPGIIDPSYLNKYLEKLREPCGERNVLGSILHTTMSGVEHEEDNKTHCHLNSVTPSDPHLSLQKQLGSLICCSMCDWMDD